MEEPDKDADKTDKPAPRALVEAALYLDAEPLTAGQVARISGITRAEAEDALNEIERICERDPSRGLQLKTAEGRYRLVPRREVAAILYPRYGEKVEKLSRAAMETLSIVAYSQPVTRAEIETLRGVGADSMMRLLLKRELIREIGRRESFGNPAQYGTTDKFLSLFGLSSISDLPRLPPEEEKRFE